MRFAPGISVLVAAIATGCGGSSHGGEQQPAETSTTGALTVDWTVKGAADPNACTSVAASAIEITVVSGANQPIGTFQQSCSAFSTSITLAAGNYAATARLLDAAGTAVTRVHPIDVFTMHVKSQLTVPIDFAEDAFVVRR